MNLRKSLDILKYYGMKVLYEELDNITNLHPDEQDDLEDAIDEVRSFILSMEDK